MLLLTEENLVVGVILPQKQLPRQHCRNSIVGILDVCLIELPGRLKNRLWRFNFRYLNCQAFVAP